MTRLSKITEIDVTFLNPNGLWAAATVKTLATGLPKPKSGTNHMLDIKYSAVGNTDYTSLRGGVNSIGALFVYVSPNALGTGAINMEISGTYISE
jgi:hypothetical protein